jgi:hypothetical protein
MNKSLLDQLSDNDFKKLVSESYSFSELARKIGYK